MTTLKNVADYAALQTGIASRFFCAWFYAENGENIPDTNNFGNVSYCGEGVPSGGVFQGVTRVEANQVVVYDTWKDGIDAFIHELSIPKGPTKWLSFDLSDLKACDGNIEAMAKLVGESNWATSHYNDGKGPGSLILDAYNNSVVSDWYCGLKAVVPTRSGQITHVVKSGETLSSIANDYRVPVQVLAEYNGIENENLIDVGQKVVIPVSLEVRPGDSLSAFAGLFHTTVEVLQKINQIADANHIVIGQVIWV